MFNGLLSGGKRSAIALDKAPIQQAQPGREGNGLSAEVEETGAIDNTTRETAVTVEAAVEAPTELDPSACVGRLAHSVRGLAKAASREERSEILARMQEEVRSLKSACTTANVGSLTTLSGALGKLLGALGKDPDR